MLATGTTVPAGPTFTVHEAVFALSVVRTVTVAVSPEVPVPSDTALTVPSCATLTISVSLDSHVTDLSAALSGLTVAISFSDIPTSSVSSDLLSVTPLTWTTCGESPPPRIIAARKCKHDTRAQHDTCFSEIFHNTSSCSHCDYRFRIPVSFFSIVINNNFSVPICQHLKNTKFPPHSTVHKNAVVKPKKIERPSMCTGTKELSASAPKETAVVKNDSKIAKGSRRAFTVVSLRFSFSTM